MCSKNAVLFLPTLCTPVLLEGWKQTFFNLVQTSGVAHICVDNEQQFVSLCPLCHTYLILHGIYFIFYLFWNSHNGKLGTCRSIGVLGTYTGSKSHWIGLEEFEVG